MKSNLIGAGPMLMLWAILQNTPHVFAQGVLVNFTTRPGISVGVMPPGLTNGSVITGQIRVNLSTLPAPAHPLPGISIYDYGRGGIAGYEFDLSTSAGLVHYDAFNSLNPNQNIYHLGSRILLQERPEDYFYFTATEQGAPFYAELQLQDLAAPFTLLNGTSFPDSVNDLNARTFGQLNVQDAAGENYFQASISSISFTAGDSDGDGVPDAQDQCPDTPKGAVVSEHGCSIEQLAPCAGPATGGAWRNHGEYVSAVVAAADAFLAAGLITAEERKTLVVEAAHSWCGMKPRGAK